MEAVASLASAMEAFITEEQLEFNDNAVSEIKQVGRFIKSQKHLWTPLLDDFSENGNPQASNTGRVHVSTLRVGNPQVVLIAVPPGASIPIHSHGKGVYGVSGLLTGDLIEVGYMADGERIIARNYTRITVYHGIAYQQAGLHHAVANVEKGEPALIVECWMRRLEFTPLKLVGRSIRVANG